MPSRPTFDALLEALPDATLGVDASECVAFANAAARELLGRDPVGTPLRELAPPLHATRRPLGEYTLVTLRDADPRVLRAALDNAPAAIFAKDTDGRYLLVNRALARLHGRPAAEIIGRLDRDLLGPETADRLRLHDLQVLAERAPIEVQEEITHAGVTRTFLAVTFPLLDEDGQVTGVGGVATDVSDRVRLEARVREAQRLEAVGQLAAGVAHEFNDLIAVIANYAAFVRKDVDPGSRTAKDVEQIIAAGRRASELTRRLLVFSRRQAANPQILSLRRVLDGLDLLLARTLGDGVQLTVRCEESLWDVEADRASSSRC